MGRQRQRGTKSEDLPNRVFNAFEEKAGNNAGAAWQKAVLICAVPFPDFFLQKAIY